MIVRLWRIGNPKQVVFDEVHFGGFANQYIKGDFFMGNYNINLLKKYRGN